jgi:hypothetical protein
MISTTLPARRISMTPAQRIVLLLGVPATLALVAWTGYSIVASTAQGSYTDGYTEAVTGTQLTLNVDNGMVSNVNVEGGAATGSVKLSQTVTYGLVRPDLQPALNVTRGVSGTSIDFGCQQWNNCDVNALAAVRPQTAVTVSTNGGNATVGDLAAPVSASTNSGNLTASNLTDGGTLSSGGGNITATAVSGSTTMLSGGGQVYADQITGNLEMSSQGGNIQATGLATPDLSVDSGGGFVALTMTQAPANLQVDAEGGNVTIILPPGSTRYDVRVDAQGDNSPNGTIASTVPSSPTSKNVITVNSGGGDVTIS